MDKKDKDIIYHLDRDARISYSRLAKLTKISQETIRYRINNLIKKGIIRKSVVIINATKLGIIPYQLFLKLQNINENIKEKIINSIKDDNRIAWIANTEGNYDLAIIIAAKNPFDFQDVIEKVSKFFNKKIIKKTLSVHISGNFFPRDYLTNKRRENTKFPSYIAEKEIIKLNKIDSQICSFLAEDGRISFVEIASKINLSADAVAKRFKKLREDGIIKGSLLILNQEKIGQLYYKVLLHLSDLSQEKIGLLLNRIRTNNRVLAIIKTLAEWDYELDIEVEHPNQLRGFIMGLTEEFSSIIKDYEIIRIIDMPKYSFMP